LAQTKEYICTRIWGCQRTGCRNLYLDHGRRRNRRLEELEL